MQIVELKLNKEMCAARAGQNFQGYLLPSTLHSERSGPLIQAMSEGHVQNWHVLSCFAWCSAIKEH